MFDYLLNVIQVSLFAFPTIYFRESVVCILANRIQKRLYIYGWELMDDYKFILLAEHDGTNITLVK